MTQAVVLQQSISSKTRPDKLLIKKEMTIHYYQQVILLDFTLLHSIRSYEISLSMAPRYNT